MSLPEYPETRREQYLSVIAGQNTTDILPEKPLTREEQYLDYIAVNGGGGGGTSDYTDLSNKPQINSVELTGNKTGAAFGLAAAEDVTGIQEVIPDTATSSNKLATAADISNEEIAATATGSSISITDGADADLLKISAKGKSEVVSGEMVSVGASGITITATDGTNSTTATITTAKPYRAPSDDYYDSIDGENVITACGEIDLGDLTWTKNANNEFVTRLIGRYTSSGNSKLLLCTKYASGHSSIRANKSIWFEYYNTPEDILVKDSDYADATGADFKTAVTGEKLVYKLQTDVTTPLSDSEKAALAALKTYENTTTISATDSPVLLVEYIKNTANGNVINTIIDMIDDKQDELTFDSTPTASSDNPVTSGGVYTALSGKAETTNITVSVPAASWTGASAPYTQTVNVTGITATDTPILDVVVSSTVSTGLAEISAFGCISTAETGAGTITFSCYESKPTTDMTIAVKVVR